MKTVDVIKYFGSKTKVARSLQCSRAAVSGWGELVPHLREFEIEVKTGGALLSDYTLNKMSVLNTDNRQEKA